MKATTTKKSSFSESTETLVTVLDAMDSPLEMKRFIFDVLTPSEQHMVGRRLIIASMLHHGIPHNDIAAIMHVGYGNLSRIQTKIDVGTKSLRAAVDALDAEAEQRKENYVERRQIPTVLFSVEWFAKRYRIS